MYRCTTRIGLLLDWYPANITLLRGNHESRQLTQVLCVHGGLSPDVRTIDQLLPPSRDRFITSSTTDGHMKLSSPLMSLSVASSIVNKELYYTNDLLKGRKESTIRVIDRNCEIPHEGPFCDLMWSDPEEIDTWAVSPRGAGWLFGSRVTAEFNHINKLDLVCRAHQLVQEGLKYMFDKGLVTVSYVVEEMMQVLMLKKKQAIMLEDE
ncbi:serine threonine-protein phosphatase [Musa troglodytarum]|uniref:Serine/threonine-protein phosphatase n=1 Tax=Musa troglodytarum TaxID=320322 RepID=A0A9E7L593_9LILI|nr:serine threonine-protein phosphatase [Musa troglodytarum]